MFKKFQSAPLFTVFGLVRFFKSNNFCLKIRFSQAQHAISDFCFFFKDRCFFYATFFYTCDKQVLWESAGAFFSARQLSDFTRQLARFTRSWSSGKMLAFQPRGFVFEPVGMR